MNVEIANALYRYFKGLYELNQNIIMLYGIDVLDNNALCEELFEKVVHMVPRLVPYKYDKVQKAYQLEKGDGLLEFEKDMPFITADYQEILKNNYRFLDNVKKIRNKLEHRAHGVKVRSTGSGNICLFDIIYEINGERIVITAGQLIGFVKKLNTIFSKIQHLLMQYMYEQNKQNYTYYRRLLRFSFCDFNCLYRSELIRIFGKALLPF